MYAIEEKFSALTIPTRAQEGAQHEDNKRGRCPSYERIVRDLRLCLHPAAAAGLTEESGAIPYHHDCFARKQASLADDKRVMQVPGRNGVARPRCTYAARPNHQDKAPP